MSSSDFSPGAFIPIKYSQFGDNINPSLIWDSSTLPSGTQSLALIVDDPDAPNGVYTHWLVKNISPTQNKIDEDTNPGVAVTNSANEAIYVGPSPPSGVHRYFFQLYAMPTKTIEASTRQDFYNEVKNDAICAAVLMGRYAAPPH